MTLTTTAGVRPTTNSTISHGRSRRSGNAQALARAAADSTDSKLRVLTLGIETRPHSAYAWDLWHQNIATSQIIEPGHVISLAAKWYGEKARFWSDFTTGHDAMIDEVWHLVDQADVVVTYNSVAFDMRHLNREFVLAGLNPPSPYKNVDLLRVVHSNFKFASGELDYVAQQLGLGTNTSRTGFQLWLDCMAGDPKAWRLMERRNKQDVDLTEKLYDRLRPWIKNHPHLGIDLSKPDACSRCGHDGPHEYTGLHHTQTRIYDRFRCRACGANLHGAATRSSSPALRLA